MENKKITKNHEGPKKKLSIVRLLITIIAITGFAYFGFTSLNRLEETQATINFKPWFAPYVDITATPRYQFEQFATVDSQKNAVLAFIVASKSEGSCTPSWGGVYTLEEAAEKLDLDRRIARFRQQGGNIAISFGGLINNELSSVCSDKDMLIDAYNSIVDRYQIDTIDLDLEGSALADTLSMRRRAEVISSLQKKIRQENRNLAVWVTLPVAPYGMTKEGTTAILEMLSSGVDLAGINVMTMDYGNSKDTYTSMSEASERALIETHRQLGILYKKVGMNLSERVLWSKIGTTPMIGQNDIVGEIFTLEDAKSFNAFALEKGVARISIWSGNRDKKCGENYVNVSVVSDSCSGIKQEKFDFSNLLASGFGGNITSNASAVTQESSEPIQNIDDPTTSPYQIWNESSTYLEGTKVVWHKNVYEAKWWNKGELPDNPVLESWETPWLLIGPVLPGEQPILQPTLPPGTYPEWSGSTIYEAGNRVLFDAIPYQAKWWTQGDSPAAASSNPDSSPWVVLNQEEIESIIQEINNTKTPAN